MTGVYILLAICIVLALAAIVLSIYIIKRQGTRTQESATVADIKATGEDMKSALDTTIRVSNSMLAGTINAQNQSTRELTQRFDGFMVSVDAKLDRMKEETARNILEVKTSNASALKEVRDDNAKNLAAMKQDNSEQLEKMRQTVDEKLSSTLEQRFNQSFKMVGERLMEINSTFNALKGLQNDVNDLNKIFKNVKTRGTWGEVSLDSLLSQLLTEDQYVKQAQLSRTEGEGGRVDFAIKLPGKGDGTVYLPIDAKFPLEDYQRLVDASSVGDAALVDSCAKALCEAVLKQGRSIRDKYVKPPKTTDFAVMYLPIEGLYAEIVRRTDILNRLQNECHVVVCGPTTLSALLNSLRMGFRSVAIEKRSTEIAKLLEQFQRDFVIFSKYLTTLRERVGTVQKSINDAEKKSNSISTRLNRVTKIDVGSDEIDLLQGLAQDNEDLLLGFDTEDNNEG